MSRKALTFMLVHWQLVLASSALCLLFSQQKHVLCSASQWHSWKACHLPGPHLPLFRHNGSSALVILRSSKALKCHFWFLQKPGSDLLRPPKDFRTASCCDRRGTPPPWASEGGRTPAVAAGRMLPGVW